MTERKTTPVGSVLATVLDGLAEMEPGRADSHRALAAELRGETYTPGPRVPATYVAIDAAHVFGASGDSALAVGRVFALQPDGSLRPLDGPGLVQLAEDFPVFARRWRIEPPE